MTNPLGLLLALVAALPAPRAEAPVYAALPLRDLSASPGAARGLLGRLRAELRARGARFTPPAELEAILRERRIRYTDSVSAADARALAERTGARWLLAGTLIVRDPGPDPRISVALRVLDAEGRRVQSTLVSLRGRDFRGLLGLGAITEAAELEAEVVARLLADFAADGGPRPPTPSAAGRRRSPASESFFQRDDFDPARVERVAVLPLENRSRRPEAGPTFAEILSHRIFRTAGVEVVEPSELRAAMIRERVRSVDVLDAEALAGVGRAVGARYFVVGTVETYSDEVFVGGDRYPEIEATVRLLDVEQGLLVAGASRRRRGDEYHVLLGLGIVHDLVELADRTAGELVTTIGLHR